jgi:hypothetical protein
MFHLRVDLGLRCPFHFACRLPFCGAFTPSRAPTAFDRRAPSLGEFSIAPTCNLAADAVHGFDRQEVGPSRKASVGHTAAQLVYLHLMGIGDDERYLSDRVSDSGTLLARGVRDFLRLRVRLSFALRVNERAIQR